ncbi:thioesterase family protein [Paenibacillus sediminis]|uniref:Acyl-CoA thioester hydrolase n=1 Tax=Paenibacillus sediminis TaxID=664909 RepID=A0ABS4H685_9BACL|nr:thioesterase family protein [Paenibacillus sediminis]MBP1937585.1 acyl-CoA thioester hydrolase [Paenibacillus sediminis]
MRQISYVQPDPQGWLQKFQFSIPIKVRYSETDLLGHLNNVSYFIYFEQGRVDYLEHLELSDSLFNQETISVVADLECQYLGQIFIKDPLKLHVRIAKLGRSSFDLEYAVVQALTGELKAVGRGAMVYIDTKSGKSLPLPDDARAKIIAFEGANVTV